MKNQLQHSDLLSLFLNDTPMLDVRAPVEYQQGAFPNTVNVPILNNEEREAIGIRYKDQGNEAAVALGAELVKDKVKDDRVQQWQAFVDQHPEGVVYCFRGGMRSQIAQLWIKENSTIEYPRVAGGYKAMRHFLIDAIERLTNTLPIIILSGRTGSGKTRLLKQLPNAIDLEGLANHRGSAFGPTATPQPKQIDFENQLAIELLKAEARGDAFIVLEDEGRNIGSVHLPIPLFEQMGKAKIVLLEVENKDRISISLNEYIDEIEKQFIEIYNDKVGLNYLEKYLLESLEKIKKRLGGVRYQALKQEMELAIEAHKTAGDKSLYRNIIETLLINYYDPMYDYQISNKQQRIIHKGDQHNVLDYLQQLDREVIHE